MKTAYILAAAAFVAALSTGCVTRTKYIDGTNAPMTAALSDRDIRFAVNELVSSLLASGQLDTADGKPSVMVIGRVVNDSMQSGLNTDIITDDIISRLRESGKVQVTAAYTGDPNNIARADESIYATRTLRDDDEFDGGTVADKGTLQAATLSLSGRITQRQMMADGRKKEVDYYLMMRVVDQKTGLEKWSKQVYIGKVADRKTQTW